MNFAGSGPQWVLVAALCGAVCCFPYQCAGLLVQTAGKAPRNSQINFSSAEKTAQKVKNTSTQILAPVFKRKVAFPVTLSLLLMFCNEGK